MLLYTDGASRGNPGKAAAGGVCKDENGVTLFEFSEFLGTATNNVAEYKALIIGLEKILKLPDEKAVKVFSDSELLVRQVRGIYRVREPSLQLLIQEVARLKSGLTAFEISHIPREDNKEADRLANEALNGMKKDGHFDMFDIAKPRPGRRG